VDYAGRRCCSSSLGQLQPYGDRRCRSIPCQLYGSWVTTWQQGSSAAAAFVCVLFLVSSMRKPSGSQRCAGVRAAAEHITVEQHGRQLQRWFFECCQTTAQHLLAAVTVLPNVCSSSSSGSSRQVVPSGLAWCVSSIA
jgi:hypothetical protein